MGSLTTILQANNTTHVDKAKYQAAVDMQIANNKKSAMITSLDNFNRSLRNSYRVEAAGKEYNEAVSSLAGTLEGRATNRINSSLAAADKLGALRASASAAGVGGSSTDMLDSTVRLQRNIEQDLKRQETERLASAGGRASAQIMDNANKQMDNSQSFGSFDHTVYIEPKRMKHRLGKLIGVAAATYFGGPQAGEAAASGAVAEWQAANGNFSGAAQSWDRALSSGVSAYKTWSSLQGDGENQSWFSAVTQKSDKVKSNAAAADQAINWGSFDANNSDSIFGSGFGSNWN